MTPDQTAKIKQGLTPSWLKKTLIALLLLSALAGYAGLFFFPMAALSALASHIGSDSSEQPLNEFRFEQISSLLDDTARKIDPGITVCFDGVLRGETGTVAIINNEMVVPGSKTEEGIKVIDIQDRLITLEYRGQTRRITIGETAAFVRQSE